MNQRWLILLILDIMLPSSIYNPMSTFDRLVSLIVAVGYNIGTHMLASNVSKMLEYDDRMNRTVMVLIGSGMLAIFSARQLKTNKDRKSIVLAQGLWYGGLLLVLTPILLIWSGVDNDMKIVLLIILLGLIVCYTGDKLSTDKPDQGVPELDLDDNILK